MGSSEDISEVAIHAAAVPYEIEEKCGTNQIRSKLKIGVRKDKSENLPLTQQLTRCPVRRAPI